MDSQAPTKRTSWEDLPSELRDIIFDYLSEEHRNKNDYFGVACRCDRNTVVPSLLIALRGLPVSYYDALKRFNTANEELYTNFPLNVNQISLFNVTELRAFKSMTIRGEPSNFHDRARSKVSDSMPYLIVPRVLRQMSLATNLRQLRIDMGRIVAVERGNCRAARAFMTEFPFFLAHFTALDYVRLEIPLWRTDILTRYRIVHGMIRRIASKLQAHATLLFPPADKSWDNSVCPQSSRAGYEVWIWEAEEGESMDWSQVAHIGLPYTRSLAWKYKRTRTSADHCVFEAGFYLAFVGGLFLLHDGDNDHREGYIRYKVDYGFGVSTGCAVKGHDPYSSWRH